MTNVQELELHLPPLNKTVRGLQMGDPTKPRLLCFHGWQDNAASFIPLAPYLKNYCLMSFDFLGHGHSDWIGEGATYNLSDGVLTILFIADALKIEKMNLLSHSMGAALSGFLATTMPERVQSAVLIEALLPYPHPPERILTRVNEAYQRAKKLKAEHPHVFATKDEAIKVRMMATPMDDTSARHIVNRNLKPVEGGYRWRFDQRVKNHSVIGLSLEQSKIMLKNLQVPILSIRGRDGMEFSRIQAQIAAGYKPGLVEDVELPGGHHIHMDSPKTIGSRIEDYFSANM